ncbi:hypothetical protein [Fructobacillus fructosus]|uniref:hypothetical protein n=1 Tax=Fructobacillus fructosus TaxID=1631 RepID=UPI001658B7C0|nr:hypothetical protein [Fructobacillus fructosus]MBC9118640.1 hypothetical protein [Fructobacillus fructosus]MBD9365304.1 hypothetical protein [Leuconostoc mesenteroides]
MNIHLFIIAMWIALAIFNWYASQENNEKKAELYGDISGVLIVLALAMTLFIYFFVK